MYVFAVVVSSSWLKKIVELEVKGMVGKVSARLDLVDVCTCENPDGGC